MGKLVEAVQYKLNNWELNSFQSWNKGFASFFASHFHIGGTKGKQLNSDPG